MFKIMKKLISKRFYATKEEAQDKCDVFFAVGRLTEAEYKELTAMVAAAYGEEQEVSV